MADEREGGTARPPYVGSPVARVEDRALLTGRATFVDDVELQDELHVAFVRSAVAHARVRSVDAGAACALPGVADVVTAADLDIGPLVPPIENPAALRTPRPLLAGETVRFVGEPVALAAAADRYVAEDAAERVEVDYEGLPVVADPEAALAPDAPSVLGVGTNVLYDAELVAGDPDAGFAAAAAVVEASFVNPRYSATPMEPRGAAALPDGDGVLVWSSTQVPHTVAAVIAELLGLPPDAVRVRCPSVGGGFGQKAHVYPEEILIAWLALRLGRPVKWTEDRSENLLSSSHARDQVVRVRAAADGEGRLLAIDADVVCDSGAYGVYPHGHLLEPLGTPAMIPGPYLLENYRARSRSVATNKCPEGAYRGVGLPVAAFVHERLMDMLAGALEIDRAEIRRRNFVPPQRMPFTTVTNQRYDSGDYRRALDVALEAIGYAGFPGRQREARARGRLLGLGVSSYVEYTGLNSRVFSGRGMAGIAGFDSAHVAVDEAGRVRVWTTLPDIGQGVSTTFAQLTADGLGVALDAVEVARADTRAGGLRGTGVFASRSAVAGGGAIGAATAELGRRLREDAAERLEISPDDLVVAGGAVQVAGAPSQRLPIGEIVSTATDPGRYRVSVAFDPPAVTYPYATHACVVEVDAQTGAIVIDRYVVAEDCGRILNPIVVEGQAHGAVAQGIGGTLLEALVYGPDGQLVTGSLMDYLLPTAMDLPAVELSHLEIPAPESPNGAKGVGEGGTLAPPAAIANAVSDALGVAFNQLPLTPERVRRAAVACVPA